MKEQVLRELVEPKTRVDSLAVQLTATKQNLATGAETLRLSHERNEFGVGAILEDIQAQQDLTRAGTDYFATIAEYVKAQYALSKAFGILSLTAKSATVNGY